jgi:hypothetical protein
MDSITDSHLNHWTDWGCLPPSIELHSDNDPFISLAEAQHVADSLGISLRMCPGRSHFFSPGEELIQACFTVADAAAAAAVGEQGGEA